MKRLYALIGWAIVALGTMHMLATFRFFHTLNGAALWFFTGGLAIALTGALNLLQSAYGRAAPRRPANRLHLHERGDDNPWHFVRRRESRQYRAVYSCPCSVCWRNRAVF
jgi:hypothetical protein